MSAVFSTPEQLARLADILSRYIRLPFSQDTIPGAVLEGALAHVRDAAVLQTYDFVDVLKADARIGWQVKSTKSTTPVTWKRAKIPQQEQLIVDSRHILGKPLARRASCKQIKLPVLDASQLPEIIRRNGG